MEMLNVLAALLLYGGFHSLTAATRVKAMFAGTLGDRAYLGLYRLLYSVVSVLTLLPILRLMAAHPGRTVWNADGIAAAGLLAIRGAGAIGLVVALLQVDLLRFLGIKGMIAYVRARQLPLPPEPLSTRGVYRLVRHPLYLFSLMALWASPTMTEAGLGFTLGATIYFVLGSLLEERKMMRTFGPEYVAYRKAVPWLIPFVKRAS